MIVSLERKYHKWWKLSGKLTSGGMLAVSPATLAHHTMRYEYAAIHTMEPMKVTGKNLFPLGVRVSGNVNHNGKIIGATNK